ncbi:hypothetical protein DPMN_173478 [Dreissena polymorpha]|uniref:Uncharacterized protein n=1 Tax=Dreissena polymorpha TaxID=45954 RepID=A0A9D4E5I9_DREPO|nr:hypothetical protein DPMN_173478 [Dreissena polymorpha]
MRNGHLYTDLYVKPTDKQLYIRKDSCQPPSSKRSLHMDSDCEYEEYVNRKKIARSIEMT